MCKIIKKIIYILLIAAIAGFLAIMFLPIGFEKDVGSGVKYSERYYELKSKSFLTDQERIELEREIRDYEVRTRRYWESRGFKAKEGQ